MLLGPPSVKLNVKPAKPLSKSETTITVFQGSKMFKYFKKLKRKLFPPKPPKYPCQECIMTIMNQGCTQLCDKMEMDDNKLRKHMEIHRKCPDCGSSQFFEGPSGGMSMNISCCGCGHKFNNSMPLAFERI
jgi:hypothetical protein